VVPPTERWIEADGARLFVRVWGEENSRDVLYWHGVGLNSRAGAALGEAGEQLARDHDLRILAIDAPGFGRSPALDPEHYHPHALADLVPAFLDRLDTGRAAFMGFSWGADIGCHTAARHADRIRAFVLLDGGYSDPPFDPALPYEHYLGETREEASELESITVDPAVVAAVKHGISQSLPSRTRPQLTLPVLLVAAAEADEEELDRFRADVPQADLVRVTEPGHDVLARGGPETARLVGEWLA
jgi:pimeloyl-ACP methyl ester carboxylesterase